jgi:hypothetical protein
LTSVASVASAEAETPTESSPSGEPDTKALATFYHQATPATTYWRCELPAKFLPGRLHGAPSMQVFVDEEGKIQTPDVENGVAIVQFPGDNGAAVTLMALQAKGGKFFVEVDDYYLDASDPLWHHRSGWGDLIGQVPHTTQGHRWICEHATGVIVTTEALAEAYRKVNENVFVCRNAIDPSDWPTYVKPRDDVFRIGWYASGSHDRDEIMVRKALAWASRQPNVEIVTLGINPPWNIARRWVGWQNDLKAHRPELMKLDVGVAPLIGTPMTKYRSDLKALEYSISGAMPMLQGDRPYDEWRELPFARMCWTEADWQQQIKWAVRNQDEVRARGAEAREFVLRERTFTTEIDRWREAIQGEKV